MMETESGYLAYGKEIREGDVISGIIGLSDSEGRSTGSKTISGKVVRSVIYTVNGIELKEMRNKRLVEQNTLPIRHFVSYSGKGD